LNEQLLKQEPSISANKQLEGNLEILIDQVWNDLQGQVSRAAIQQALIEIVPKYEEATVTTYVPILIRRDTVDSLRGTSTQAEVEPVTERKPLPEQIGGGHTPRGIRRFWRRLESLLGQLRMVEQ
jgi:hypothetical protein